jgi:hypothetical protein
LIGDVGSVVCASAVALKTNEAATATAATSEAELREAAVPTHEARPNTSALKTDKTPAIRALPPFEFLFTCIVTGHLSNTGKKF